MSANQDPPALTTTRYGEDYSYLADLSSRSGEWWEPLKHIPIGADPDVYLSTGTEFRLRQEVYNERQWGASPAPNDSYTLARALPYVDLHVGSAARAFVQLSIAYVSGGSLPESPVEQTGVDVAQAFVEVSTPVKIAEQDIRLSIRGGRRQISLGAGRLIAPRYVPNVMQAFDGGFATLAIGKDLAVQAIYARPVVSGTANFDDRSGDASLWALYSARQGLKMFGGVSSLDLYYIGYQEDEARFDQGSGDEVRHTLGARVAGRAANWDWDWELMYQFGSFGDGRIAAWSLGTRTGYTWNDHRMQPRVMLEASVISGDADPDNRDLQTFNALFPNGNFFGELTPVGPYNLITAGPTATAQVAANIEVEVQALFHWRESRRDGLYNVPGILVRSGATSQARRIGTQGSVTITWAPVRTFDLMASYNAFGAGPFLEETGRSKTTHFLGAQARFRY